jgi:UDP-N-acetylmuramoyl-L-alanyl-D-glutamate--2,6-diaminopimelate ligase
MIQMMLNGLKSILGDNISNSIRPLGHGLKSYCAAMYYGFPASKLTVIGITGTKGKTSTTVYTGRLLNLNNYKAGYISTALVYDGRTKSQSKKANTRSSTWPSEEANIFKMTSLDGIVLHRTLREMVKNGCSHVVIELSSQGLAQNRHWGLGTIDIGVFLNIFPEHIEAHGGWDNYVKAKSILFKNLDKNGIFIAESKAPQGEVMWNAVPNKVAVTKSLLTKGSDYSITTDQESGNINLTYSKHKIKHHFNASFEALNTAFALHILQLVNGKNLSTKAYETVDSITGLPGRMDWVVREGTIIEQKEQKTIPEKKTGSKKIGTYIDILVDYAHEPESMKQLMQTLYKWRKSSAYTQVIHILSCDGAGRDDWKKSAMGDLSYKYSNYTILTTDNYTKNDNPCDIIDLLGQNYPKTMEGNKYIRETNRLKAFEKALELASNLTGKTLIVSTGVGSEYGLTQPNGVMKWNEVDVWNSLFKDKFVTTKKATVKTSKNKEHFKTTIATTIHNPKKSAKTTKELSNASKKSSKKVK